MLCYQFRFCKITTKKEKSAFFKNRSTKWSVEFEARSHYINLNISKCANVIIACYVTEYERGKLAYSRNKLVTSNRLSWRSSSSSSSSSFFFFFFFFLLFLRLLLLLLLLLHYHLSSSSSSFFLLLLLLLLFWPATTYTYITHILKSLYSKLSSGAFLNSFFASMMQQLEQIIQVRTDVESSLLNQRV